MSSAPPPSRRQDPAWKAAEAAWDRGSGQGDEGAADGTAALRRRGLLQALVGLAAGTLIWFFWHRALAPVVWGLASITGLAALLSPTGVYAAISRGLEALGRGIGRALTVVLLAPLFYLFFTPFGLLARRGRRDPLERRWEGGAVSYWRRREPADPSPARYERQF